MNTFYCTLLILAIQISTSIVIGGYPTISLKEARQTAIDYNDLKANNIEPTITFNFISKILIMS